VWKLSGNNENLLEPGDAVFFVAIRAKYNFCGISSFQCNSLKLPLSHPLSLLEALRRGRVAAQSNGCYIGGHTMMRKGFGGNDEKKEGR